MSKQTTSRFEHHRERVKRAHKHPFIVPVATFFALFIVSMAVFIFGGATTVNPTDSHVVKLHVDGTSQTLPSRAPTVGDLLDRTGVKLSEHDVVEPARDAVITDDNFAVNIYRAHPVKIVEKTDKGTTTSGVQYSAQQAPAEIAKQAGYEVHPEDKVSMAPSSDVLKKEGVISQTVLIERAAPVVINLYGNPIATRTQAKTVGEVLAQKDIKPVEGDTVSPAADTPIVPNMAIFVVSHGKQIETREEEIPAPVETVNDSALPVGTTKVREEGKSGKKLVTYEVEIKNGQEAGRKPIQEVVAVEPVKRVVVKGTKVVETRISGDKAAVLAAAGVPTSQHFAADFIIGRESGWNLAARNGSGCLGLGQACPGQKLVNACPNWQSDATCQIQFFSSYANGRYGSWQAAYEAWLVKHWW